jgi:hypothetical protein
MTVIAAFLAMSAFAMIEQAFVTRLHFVNVALGG